MVKDHSDSEKGNPLLPHRLLFMINTIAPWANALTMELHGAPDSYRHRRKTWTSAVKLYQREISKRVLCEKHFQPIQLKGSLFNILVTICNQFAFYTVNNTIRKCFLFNDAHNTFYLQLYGVKHMVKDHSDSEQGNPLPPYRLLFPINSKGSFICTIAQTG